MFVMVLELHGHGNGHHVLLRRRKIRKHIHPHLMKSYHHDDLDHGRFDHECANGDYVRDCVHDLVDLLNDDLHG
jgi:hypothetical protein